MLDYPVHLPRKATVETRRIPSLYLAGFSKPTAGYGILKSNVYQVK
jgi:hypothetical protein